MADRADPAFKRHIDALWHGESEQHLLFEAAEAVQRLQEHPGWQAVLAVIESEVATIDRSLDQGAARSAEEYAKAHGRRGALRALEEAANAIIEAAAQRRLRAERMAAPDAVDRMVA